MSCIVNIESDDEINKENENFTNLKPDSIDSQLDDHDAASLDYFPNPNTTINKNFNCNIETFSYDESNEDEENPGAFDYVQKQYANKKCTNFHDNNTHKQKNNSSAYDEVYEAEENNIRNTEIVKPCEEFDEEYYCQIDPDLKSTNVKKQSSLARFHDEKSSNHVKPLEPKFEDPLNKDKLTKHISDLLGEPKYDKTKLPMQQTDQKIEFFPKSEENRQSIELQDMKNQNSINDSNNHKNMSLLPRKEFNPRSKGRNKHKAQQSPHNSTEVKKEDTRDIDELVRDIVGEDNDSKKEVKKKKKKKRNKAKYKLIENQNQSIKYHADSSDGEQYPTKNSTINATILLSPQIIENENTINNNSIEITSDPPEEANISEVSDKPDAVFSPSEKRNDEFNEELFKLSEDNTSNNAFPLIQETPVEIVSPLSDLQGNNKSRAITTMESNWQKYSRKKKEKRDDTNSKPSGRQYQNHNRHNGVQKINNYSANNHNEIKLCSDRINNSKKISDKTECNLKNSDAKLHDQIDLTKNSEKPQIISSSNISSVSYSEKVKDKLSIETIENIQNNIFGCCIANDQREDSCNGMDNKPKDDFNNSVYSNVANKSMENVSNLSTEEEINSIKLENELSTVDNKISLENAETMDKDDNDDDDLNTSNIPENYITDQKSETRKLSIDSISDKFSTPGCNVSNNVSMSEKSADDDLHSIPLEFFPDLYDDNKKPDEVFLDSKLIDKPNQFLSNANGNPYQPENFNFQPMPHNVMHPPPLPNPFHPPFGQMDPFTAELIKRDEIIKVKTDIICKIREIVSKSPTDDENENGINCKTVLNDIKQLLEEDEMHQHNFDLPFFPFQHIYMQNNFNNNVIETGNSYHRRSMPVYPPFNFNNNANNNAINNNHNNNTNNNEHHKPQQFPTRRKYRPFHHHNNDRHHHYQNRQNYSSRTPVYQDEKFGR